MAHNTAKLLKRPTLATIGSADAATQNTQGGHSHCMSLSSEFPLAGNVLLLFERNLQQEQAELTRAIDRTHKEIRALAESGAGDIIDQSCGNSSKEAVFAIYTQNRTHLRKVQAALERIATGEFGICAACGGAIGFKRLQALPWANNCIECQEESEQGRVQ